MKYLVINLNNGIMTTNLNTKALLEQFIKEQTKTSNLVKGQYYIVMRLFFDWINEYGTDERELGISHIIKYKDHLYKENETALTIRSHLFIIDSFFKWLFYKEIYKNITDRFKLPKLPESDIYMKEFTPEQIKQETRMKDLLQELEETSIEYYFPKQ